MVRAVGLEPTLLSEPDFESGASTSFTTPAANAAPWLAEAFGASDATTVPAASSLPLLGGRARLDRHIG